MDRFSNKIAQKGAKSAFFEFYGNFKPGLIPASLLRMLLLPASLALSLTIHSPT